MAEERAVPEVFLEELPVSSFDEYLRIFNEARKKGTLGKVLPPKTMQQMMRWKKHGTTFFYVKNKSEYEGIPEGRIIGVCGVSQNRLLKSRFQIINQYILPNFRGKHFAESMLAEQERFAINQGAKRLHAFLYYFDKAQYKRFRNAQFKWGALPSIGHLLKGRISGKVVKKVRLENKTKPPFLKRLLRG